MKLLLSFLVLATISSSAWARDPMSPKQLAQGAFEQNEAVQQAIVDLKANFISPLADEPEATEVVLLGSGCGFAGCDYRYLVVQRYGTEYRVNAQSESVAAIVEVGSLGDVRGVQLVNLKPE